MSNKQCSKELDLFTIASEFSVVLMLCYNFYFLFDPIEIRLNSYIVIKGWRTSPRLVPEFIRMQAIRPRQQILSFVFGLPSNFYFYIFLLYCPPTSYRARVIWPKEQIFAASIRSSKILPFWMADLWRESRVFLTSSWFWCK